MSMERKVNIPRGKRVRYEDDLVRVYNDKGEVDYEGLLDYCPYKYDGYTWNEKDGCYDLPHGYRMIGI